MCDVIAIFKKPTSCNLCPCSSFNKYNGIDWYCDLAEARILNANEIMDDCPLLYINTKELLIKLLKGGIIDE